MRQRFVSLLLFVVSFLAVSIPAHATYLGQIVVANRGAGTISVIDVATNVATTIP
jgi:hypothetical protein